MYTVITPPPRETTHTPQGDGNYLINCFIASVVRNNPHPARGRKLLPDRVTLVVLGNNLHPARGRKLSHLPSCSIRRLKQPTPRKGTETVVLISSIVFASETTHTPQGDGNIFPHHIHAVAEKQPTPRKGTETLVVCVLVVSVLETTHTPQGDGNP